MRVATFTANDGEEYQYDFWYPLPFVVRNKSMLPTLKECDRLFLKFKDGSEAPWTPWSGRGVKTHWCLKSWSDYQI